MCLITESGLDQNAPTIQPCSPSFTRATKFVTPTCNDLQSRRFSTWINCD